MRHYLFLIILFFVSQNIVAQDFWSFSYLQGQHIRPDEPKILSDKITGFTFSYGRNVEKCEDPWRKFTKATYLEYKLQYQNLNTLKGAGDTSKGAFGQQIGVLSAIHIPVVHTKYFNFTVVPQFGAAYISKSYYATRMNRFSGSRFNYQTNLDLVIGLNVSQNLQVFGNFGFYHSSNGGVQLPNLGMNVLGKQIGIRAFFNPKPLHIARTTHRDNNLSRSYLELAAGGGYRGLINEQKNVFRSTLSANANLYLTKCIDLKVGMDFLWYSTPGLYLLRSTSYDPWAYAAFGGIDIKFNRMTASGGVGKYLYFNSLFNIRYYTKLGFRYLITKHVFVGLSLRSHVREADYTDFNIGYKF